MAYDLFGPGTPIFEATDKIREIIASLVKEGYELSQIKEQLTSGIAYTTEDLIQDIIDKE